MSNVRFTRPSNFPPIVKNLIIINVLVYLAQIMFDQQYQLTDKLTLQPIISDQLKDALRHNAPSVGIPHFSPYQIFTHMFTHAPLPPFSNIFHILLNMFVLWMFGRVLESVWGSKRFLTFYLICGIGAAAFHLLVQYFRSESLLLPIVLNFDQIGFEPSKSSIDAILNFASQYEVLQSHKTGNIELNLN